MFELKLNNEVVIQNADYTDFCNEIWDRIYDGKEDEVIGGTFMSPMSKDFNNGTYFFTLTLDNYRFGSRGGAIHDNLNDALESTEGVFYHPSNMAFIVELKLDENDITTLVKSTRVKTKTVAYL